MEGVCKRLYFSGWSSGVGYTTFVSRSHLLLFLDLNLGLDYLYASFKMAVAANPLGILPKKLGGDLK